MKIGSSLDIAVCNQSFTICAYSEYRQYCKERHWIFMCGLEKKLRQYLRGLDKYVKEKWEKICWIHLRGVRSPPEYRGFGHIRG